jgi:hypothetical protein
MQDPVFIGHSAIEWEGIAAIAASVAAFASLVSMVIVGFVARFTFQYMRSTKELVEAAKQQTDATIRQADASIRTLEIMNIERRETDSFQRAIFIYAVQEILSSLGHYINVIGLPTQPWQERDCFFSPSDSDWKVCRAFVSRKAPNLLEEMQNIEKILEDAARKIQGFIRAPGHQWKPTAQKREETTQYLALLRERLNLFSRNALGL